MHLIVTHYSIEFGLMEAVLVGEEHGKEAEKVCAVRS